METYAVDGNTLAAIGGILGTLAGLIVWLVKKLMSTKDEQIKSAVAAAEHAEDVIGRDRDYWRDLAMRVMAERPFGRD